MGNAVAPSVCVKHRSSSQRIGSPKLALLMAVMSFATGWAKAEDMPGTVRGSIITIESDGARSVIPAAAVMIESAELSRKTTADEEGLFGFGDLPAGRYQIRASAPGLVLVGRGPSQIRPIR